MEYRPCLLIGALSTQAVLNNFSRDDSFHLGGVGTSKGAALSASMKLVSPPVRAAPVILVFAKAVTLSRAVGAASRICYCCCCGRN